MTVPLGGTRRKQVTHAALEEAALRLFAEQGYEGTTVEEIAAAAGVAVRTFFRHFSSKQHVLFGDVAHRQIAALRQALSQRDAAEDPITALKAVMDDLDLVDQADRAQVLLRFRLMAAQPALVATYLLLSAELQNEVAVFVARCRGAAPTDFYPQLIAAAAASSWHASLTTWVAADGDADLTELRKSAFAALTAGLDPAGQT
ncbi:AcrR family transcriptional regulator [Allocatelliglobosispora scoriae]|uniref:AcrR family transcriptional regulator n=1 Tax=Allocatelliglobosispora scoriae TaxID=643052 RepID=A0A841BTS0_9ACTN|nr:TetR family transcriptional regulator [Allocatelliglobosispora scoriae]MBB5870838.1 AcrR family transcriptional regulator [Allocatelliglobosispora scoriae]